jgi:uncharacterized protein GlcG (DUF336 family)
LFPTLIRTHTAHQASSLVVIDTSRSHNPIGVSENVAVLDDGGNLKAFRRMESVDASRILASTVHPRRVMTLAEVADVAVFIASDKASRMT